MTDMRDGQILGREREIGVLTALVAAGVEQGSALVVLGEPGIGKSALLDVARAEARQTGFTVLQAAGMDSEMHLPFGGLHQTLTPLMRHLTDLPEGQRVALAAALGLADGATPDLFLIAEAALALLTRERAEGPVIIVVDDVQWLDPQSHQILTFLAHRSVTVGLVLVGAIRPGHPGPFPNAGFPQLRVSGVDDVTAERLLSSHAGGINATDLRRIREEAQGNPLALLELPRSWGDGRPTDGHPLAVSTRLEQAFAGRIMELPQATRDSLLIAAIGSSSDTDEILAALSAFGVPSPSRGLFEPAVAAGLLINDRSHINFRHPLVRSGVLQRETMARRHAAHAAVADVLIADSYRRSWHRAWSIVGPDDDVAAELAATVPDSLRRGAVMSAVSSLERAAQLTSSSARRGSWLMVAAEHAFASGRPDVVGRLLREASGVDLTELDELRVAWFTEALNGDIRANSKLVRQLCDAARRASALDDTGLALNLLLAAALRCWWADSGADDQAEVVRVVDQLAHAADDPRHLAALAIAEPVLRGSEVLRVLESVALADVTDGDSLRVYALASYAVGDFVRTTDLLDRAEDFFRANGRLGMLPVVLALQLSIRLDLGDWSGAVSAGKEVATISKETGQGLFAENNVLVEARGTALRGDWEGALAAMLDAESDAMRLRINDRICFGYQARGAALLSAEQPAAAFACLKRQFDPADPGYHLRESFAGVALMAEAAVDCGELNEARAIVRTLQTVAVLTPSPLLKVNLLYAQAVLAPEEVREARYEQALAQDLTRWPWIRSRLQLAFGRWLAQVGRSTDAVAHLDAALATFERIGAARWSRRAKLALQGLDGAAPGSAGGDR
ncbi:AAA ATPase-like protein [Jatrophihabitans sp. GAS493]|uniref:AAA family ATPase n=1 Tax=Jatrophihabitans sp. GAS493 TaxID=1907575 RepID=UPI000BC0C89B|nr:ATP-binding protein [Jatrophihabitans sp. GAS493]SOD74955.1 AAA ATPase-like protein [Jatrophihabitans sp. GAS493]